jgi:hypothetical protein
MVCDKLNDYFFSLTGSLLFVSYTTIVFSSEPDGDDTIDWKQGDELLSASICYWLGGRH